MRAPNSTPDGGQNDEVRRPGAALRLALEAVARLADMKRPRSRVLHHRRAPETASPSPFGRADP
jgi:hypothetical protein